MGKITVISQSSSSLPVTMAQSSLINKLNEKWGSIVDADTSNLEISIEPNTDVISIQFKPSKTDEDAQKIINDFLTASKDEEVDDEVKKLIIARDEEAYLNKTKTEKLTQEQIEASLDVSKTSIFSGLAKFVETSTLDAPTIIHAATEYLNTDQLEARKGAYGASEQEQKAEVESQIAMLNKLKAEPEFKDYTLQINDYGQVEVDASTLPAGITPSDVNNQIKEKMNSADYKNSTNEMTEKHYKSLEKKAESLKQTLEGALNAELLLTHKEHEVSFSGGKIKVTGLDDSNNRVDCTKAALESKVLSRNYYQKVLNQYEVAQTQLASRPITPKAAETTAEPEKKLKS